MLSSNRRGRPALATFTEVSTLTYWLCTGMTPGEDAGPEVLNEGPGSTPWLPGDMSSARSQ